jgi:hypothetical protein
MEAHIQVFALDSCVWALVWLPSGAGSKEFLVMRKSISASPAVVDELTEDGPLPPVLLTPVPALPTPVSE